MSMSFHPTPAAPATSRRVIAASDKWPLERILFALAGTMTLVSALLAALASPWFLLLTAFVGINQWLYVTLGACPASLLRRLGVTPECRW
jgi:Zn-dependent protease